MWALASCGGGGEAVRGVEAVGLRYTGSLTAQSLRVTGDALTANGIKVYANGGACSLDNSSSQTLRVATCLMVVPSSLSLPVRVTDRNDITLYSTTLTVPTPQVRIDTTLGRFVLELDPTRAPISVANYLSYVNRSPSFYVGTIFHRVDTTTNFVVQTGGFTAGLTPKTGQSDPITLESNVGLPNLLYTVGMARRGPDPGFPETDETKNSATSQFYVNLRNNTGFDYVSPQQPGYAVFGRVLSGTDVIDLIAAQPTTNNVPQSDITITAATQIQ